MKRKRQARILLGILLAALLLLPGGMRIKAEEVVSGEQPAEEVQMPVEEVENVEPTDPEIKAPPTEGNEEIAPVEPEPEKKEEEPILEEPLLEEEELAEPVQEEVPEAEVKDPELNIMAAPIEVPEEIEKPEEENLIAPMTEVEKIPELNLKSFGCDFIWGVGYGDELFDFDCDHDVGSKIKWIGIEHILGMHIKFLPIFDVRCITVEKIWRDGESKDRPYSIMFDLYADGTKVAVLPIVTNHTNNWKTKILVPKSAHGKDITYTVKEVVHPELKNYITAVSGLKIINTLTRDITVEKMWKMDHESVRPDSVSFWLMNGEEVVGGKRTLSSANGWKVVIPDVPAYDANGRIDYSIKEESILGYDSEVVEGCLEANASSAALSEKCCEPDDKCPDFTIINTFTNEKKITLIKKWIDDDAEDRPDALTFILDKSDGTSIEIPITSADGWEKEVTVEMVDVNWDEYDYAVDEKEVPEGYEKSIVVFTITNKLKEMIPTVMIEIEGEKTWIDHEGDVRPDFINVKLMADGELLETKKVVPVEGKWMYSFGEWPKYDEEMNVIEYEVVEVPVDGYMSIAGEAYDIINKKAIEVTGEKTWLDDGTGRPGFIIVKLMADGELLTTKKVMPVEGKWTYDFGMLPKYDEEMNEIEYTISEEPVEGYECIPGEDFDIANRRVGKIIVSGEKTWDDLMNRPASITVYLDRGDERLEEVEVKADAMGKWLYSFKETAQFDEEGMPYTFTVSEKYILGYEANVTGFNIHNVQQRATMKVVKVNEADKPLAGAVFEVRDLSGKVLKTFTTGADGLFSMELPLGMYRLVEVSPPPGYAKNTVPRLVILFKAGDVQTIEVVNSVDKSPFVPTPIPTYPQLPDTGGKVLPSTGAGSEMGFYFLGLASVVAGLLTMKKKRK